MVRDEAVRLLSQLQELADAAVARLSSAGDADAPQPTVEDQPHLLLLQRYLEEADAAARVAGDINRQRLRYFYHRGIRDLPSVQVILAGSPELHAALVRAIVIQAYPMVFPKSSDPDVLAAFATAGQLGLLADLLLRRKLTFSPDDIEAMLRHISANCSDRPNPLHAHFNVHTLLRSIARQLEGEPLLPDAEAALRRLYEKLSSMRLDAQSRQTFESIAGLRGVAKGDLIFGDDDWGHYALATLDELDAARRARWLSTLTLAADLKATRPTKAWLGKARALIDELGSEEFVALAVAFLGLLSKPSCGAFYRLPGGSNTPSAMIAAPNADVIKGLAWMAAVVDDERIPAALADAALACFKKIPDFGARSVKAGNACVHALAALESDAAIIGLKRLEMRLKQPSAVEQVRQALTSAAERRGVAVEDLDELAVPGFGLVDGVARIPVGDYAAELSVGPATAIELRWVRPDGRRQKTLPAALKRDHPEAVKEIRQARKALDGALLVQRARIERLLARERSWPLGTWQERYCDHPLVSLVARKLIWNFEVEGERRPGAWLDGRIVGHDDQPLELPAGGVAVRLWHPIEASTDEVEAWRLWLERHEIVQPFAQAHREIYVLTDAELATVTYSNRFAGHIVRQHQFAALCRERGWRYTLQGGWDSHNVPALALPWCGLRAEFWVDPVEGADVSDAWIYLYASTDQVRFIGHGGFEPVALAQVPPRAFSEVMRDVDLFVGVSSIGADPNWLDAGEARGMAAYQGYWWDFSFGELSASAVTRREVLVRVLPRMAKLAGRWELGERFLTVRGDLRTYKIHLGSGNILMEPNDQYLCIVPGRGATGSLERDLFLPFEGDRTLSVILSKALMLADDTSISDPTITRQIERG